jgi:filamentous hemagglutinin family protein
VTRILRASILLAALPAASPALGQVVTDGTLGAAGAVPKVGGTYRIDASLGQRRGPNLFHSFSRLDVNAGETAQFSSSQSGVTNVLARVTGGQASKIDGTLQCTIPGADFYLINPAGVVFGPTAQLDVGGSFAVTTADVVKLADGGRFDAATPANSVLTSAAPAAFGFLSAAPKAISVQGIEGDPDAFCLLAVTPGRSLTLVGGGVDILNAVLVAPAGRLDVVSVGSPGDVKLPAAGATTPMELSGFQSLGDVTVLDVSSLDVAEGIGQDDRAFGRAGSINVHGRDVFIGGGSSLQAVTADADGGGITVEGTTVTIAEEAALITGTSGPGRGGPIRVNATDLALLYDGGQISAFTEAAGPGGSVEVTAPAIEVDGTDALIETGIFANAFGGERGGDLSVTAAEQLSVISTGQISTTTFGPGRGGRVSVSAAAITLDGAGSSLFTGIKGNTEIDPTSPVPVTGAAGGAAVRAGRLEILAGAGVTSSSIGEGAGPAALVHVRAEHLLIDAQGFDRATGINSVSGALVIDADKTERVLNGGPGGAVFVDAGSLRMKHPGALIRANTFGTSDAGRVVVKADRVDVDRGSVGGDPGTGIGAQVDRGATGRGGNVFVDAREVAVRRGGRISVGTLGSGPAGSLTIHADTLRLAEGGFIESNSGDETSPAAGPGGDLTVVATRSIEASGGSRIAALSERNDAGSVTLLTPGTVLLQGSEITTQADLSGGNITIDPELVVLNSSKMTANARLQSGGNISVQAENYLKSADSGVTATSVLSTPGTIAIDARVVDIAGTLVVLSSELEDTRALLRDVCGMRLDSSASTFVVTGRGGAPAEPGGWSADAPGMADLLSSPILGPTSRPSRAGPRR